MREPELLPDVLTLDPATIDSAVLRRLIAEVQQEQDAKVHVYDRGHNRHNRGPLPRPPGPKEETHARD